MHKYSRFISLFLVLVLAALAVGMISAQDDEPIVIRTEIGASDVPTLDPALATDSSSIQILNQTYIGLTVLDEETLEVMPGMATEWEITNNDDGTVTYTFTLRDDVPWVRYNADSGEVEQIMDDSGEPRMVTAQDFLYGWQRTLDPRTAGEYAYVLAPQVAGGSDFNNQFSDDVAAAEEAEEEIDVTSLELEVGSDTLGISAPDDTTFVVTAPEFAGYQLNIFGMWMARPQPRWLIEEFGDFWIEPANFAAYGPFTLKERQPDVSITIIKNPFWPGNEVSPQSVVDEVVFFVLDSSVALAQYEAGELDVVDDVDTASIPRIKADPILSLEYQEGTDVASYYYGFSVNIEPMDNVHLRRALSYAVDRQDIVDNVTQSGQVPAPFFSSPALAAAPTTETHPDLGIRFDPARAQEELALALEELGLSDVSELPPITLLFNTSEGHQRIAEAIQSMWQETLGIEVQLTNQEFAVYLDQRATFPVWRAGWGADYPDAHNFLFDVFHSSSENNDTGFANAEFDALLEEAATLTDLEARRELYAQAEAILVEEEAAIIPIYFYSDPELTKPYVERTFSLVGDQRFENWDVSR